MKYHGIITVFLDEEKSKSIGSDLIFELDESNHFIHPSGMVFSGVASNTEKIDKAVIQSMTPILNHLVYLQQEKQKREK